MLKTKTITAILYFFNETTTNFYCSRSDKSLDNNLERFKTVSIGMGVSTLVEAQVLN
jgi:hypothetical protein